MLDQLGDSPTFAQVLLVRRAARATLLLELLDAKIAERFVDRPRLPHVWGVARIADRVGERAVVAVLSAPVWQAQRAFQYIAGGFAAVPVG